METDSMENKEQYGCVFDIQRYSIHDGPGIRTTVFLKGCSLRCFWCQNPESQSPQPEIFFFTGRCTICGRCIEVCSTGASFAGKEISEIDRSKCIGCGRCAEECPNKARKLVGVNMSVDQVLEVVMKDRKFYQNSGGGVTLSGGEPLFQVDFAVELLKKCKYNGLHTAVESCGAVPWANFEKALPYTDYFLVDIKQIDAEKHKAGTGSSNDMILDNIKKLAAARPLRVRVPLIPGFNDSPEDIRAIGNFVRSELHSVEVDLLAYNKMGESKYPRLNRETASLHIQEDSYVEMLRDIIRTTSGRDSG